MNFEKARDIFHCLKFLFIISVIVWSARLEYKLSCFRVLVHFLHDRIFLKSWKLFYGKFFKFSFM